MMDVDKINNIPNFNIMTYHNDLVVIKSHHLLDKQCVND